MRLLLIIFLLGIGVLIYFAVRLVTALSGRQTPAAPIPQPSRLEVDISVTDKGKDGMPVITIRSAGATLNVRSVEQEAMQYTVIAEKLADNVAVVSVERKTDRS